MVFLFHYFRLNPVEKVELAQQQVSILLDETYTQVSTTELEISEERKAACKTLLAFLCACLF